jgi:hypothetical protein
VNVNKGPRALILAGVLLFCLPQLSMASEFFWLWEWKSKAPPVSGDLALGAGGELQGRVSDTNGDPMTGVSVIIVQGNRTIAKVPTGANGVFVVPGLPGGIYGITVGRTRYFYRCWAPGTAPATSTTQVELVATDRDVGIYGMPWARGWFVLYR